jgi:putative nucleotidyltransferase with HDIG domain
MKKNRYLFPIVLFAVTAALIVALIPRGGRYLQRFNLGDRWSGETLTAPFDFSIAKSEAEILADRVQAEHSFVPVYTLDAAVYDRVWNALRESLEAAGMTDNYLRAAEQAVRAVYSKGISSGLDHVLTGEGGEAFVRIDRDGTLETVATREVFNPETAAEYIDRQTAAFIPPVEIDLRPLLLPNLRYNESLNAGLRERELRSVAATKGIVYAGEVIVAEGQVIDREVFNKLNSLKQEYRERIGSGNTYLGSLVGQSLIVIVLMGITFLFLFFFRKNFLTARRNVLFILMVYLLMVGFCAAVARSGMLSVYIIPFAIVPIYILTFLDMRMSVYELITVLLLCALIVARPLELIVINFVGGIVAVFVLGRAYRRERVFLATALVFVGNTICHVALTLIETGSLHAFNYLMLIWFGVGALLFLGMYQLIYVFEKLFGFVSDLTLLELGDTNQKLLMELAQKAPGTFQHALQVANLSEAAAKAIGARALLARTGALYHDIGKMANPAWFIENTGGLVNPHDSLSPAESADIIKRHVTDGVALARKVRLPAVIQEFITGHHSQSLIYYFYMKQKEMDGGRTPDPAVFTYAGVKPRSKEVSICLMADSVEAASRSLSEYTEESIGTLVDKIVDTQIREGMLSDSALSFADVERIKEVFKEYLSNTYHTRVSYPERENN